ncbi:MAG: T9SS C-terminal target domain-containing protein [Candidatus Zixiibacteriota bacterium]|nr:MAG: T9SS C-terminal target domain-containing protein [candidate division Zixibacteria bacterium]
MNTRKFLIIAALAMAGSAPAQSPDTLWTRTYGGPGEDFGYGVLQVENEKLLVVGETDAIGSTADAWIIKTNPDGDTLWTRTCGGPQNEAAYSAAQLPGGDYLITGWTSSSGAGNFDVYLIRMNAHGDTVWTRAWGTANTDYGYSVHPDTAGCFCVAGFTTGSDPVAGDGYLLKVEADGDTAWTRTFGGTGEDCFRGIDYTIDGGWILAGWTYSASAGGYDIYLLKVNSTGYPQWSRTYGGSGTDRGFCVCQTSDGGFIIAGCTNSMGAGEYDAYLVKTDPMGYPEWDRTYGGMASESVNCVRQTWDGGYIVCGSTYSYGLSDSADAYLVRTDDQGYPVWTKIIGGEGQDSASELCITADTGYAVTGNTRSYGAGNYDLWLLRLDTDPYPPPPAVPPDMRASPQPNAFALHPPHPNPFNPATAMSFELRAASYVTLRVYDTAGREVAVLVNGWKPAGAHEATFDGAGLASGIYLVRLEAGNFTQIQKLVLLK